MRGRRCRRQTGLTFHLLRTDHDVDPNTIFTLVSSPCPVQGKRAR
uniref:Uncharacterized protein n=1 Tax=Populus trichocarpa TaxID=3694 RepID=A0A3N7FGR3_POPTR